MPAVLVSRRSRVISSCWAAIRDRAPVLNWSGRGWPRRGGRGARWSSSISFFQPGDLGVPRIGVFAGLADGGEPAFEFVAQAGVGAGAVERGAVDPGFAGEGLDVAFPAGRDVAVQEPVDGSPDPGLVLAALLGRLSRMVCFLCGSGGIDRSRPGRGWRGRTRLGDGLVSVVRVRSEVTEERLGLVGVLGPDRPVAGVVGGLRAAGRITHPGERLAGVGGSGEFQAQGPGGIGEPAVVRGAQVEGAGAFGEQVEDCPGRCAALWRSPASAGVSWASTWAKNPVSSRAPGPAGMMPCW